MVNGKNNGILIIYQKTEKSLFESVAPIIEKSFVPPDPPKPLTMILKQRSTKKTGIPKAGVSKARKKENYDA